MWSGCINDPGHPANDAQRRLPEDLEAVLADPRSLLSLAVVKDSYEPVKGTTAIWLRLLLTYSVSRWKSNPDIVMHATRTATVTLNHDCPGRKVTWDVRERSFDGVSTHLGFTLETDDSELRRPFVYLQWRWGHTTGLVLFKKRDGAKIATFTDSERARLGIGMSCQEMEVAQFLATLKKQQSLRA